MLKEVVGCDKGCPDRWSGKMSLRGVFELRQIMEGADPTACVTGRRGGDSECKGTVVY